MLTAGIVPENEEDRRLVVRQSYPFVTSGRQPNGRRLPMEELSRTVTGDGTVTKFMKDKSVVVGSSFFQSTKIRMRIGEQFEFTTKVVVWLRLAWERVHSSLKGAVLSLRAR